MLSIFVKSKYLFSIVIVYEYVIIFLVMFCYDNIIIRCKRMIDLDVVMVNFFVIVDRRLLF